VWKKASQAKKYWNKVACFEVLKFGRQNTTITMNSTTISPQKKRRSTTRFSQNPLQKRPQLGENQLAATIQKFLA
jgi:hypothetical protein